MFIPELVSLEGTPDMSAQTEAEKLSMEQLLELRRQTSKNIMNTATVKSVFETDPDPALYIQYLLNVWHYAQHSSLVIGAAGARCTNSHPELSDYLLGHAREELGHDTWVLQDLADLGIDERHLRSSHPVSSCAGMIGFEYYIAFHANPVGLFGWLYVLESMGADLGELVVNQISRVPTINKGVRFLRGHSITDVDHTRDLTQQISRHIRGNDLENVYYVARVSAHLYTSMFCDIGRSHSRDIPA